ncbi:hypothetical protein ACVN42_23050 [Escherichia coli]
MKWSSGCSSESRNHEGQQHETCCDAGTLAVCKMPALVLWNPALPMVLATFPFIFLLLPSGQPIGCHSSLIRHSIRIASHWCLYRTVPVSMRAFL